MIGLTDIHNHILYKVDDGADCLETSIEMIKEEYNQGVRNIIVTPHFDVDGCTPDVQLIKDHFDILKTRAEEQFLDLHLYLGNEIMSCNDIVAYLDDERIFTLAKSKYVLIEFYPSVNYNDMIKALSKLLNNGYIPIVAHCERYKCLRASFKVINRQNIEHIIEMGAYIQVNVDSVIGRDKKFVKKLIDCDLLHLISTDAHNTGQRGIHWKECINYLKQTYNDDYLEWLLIRNPNRILNSKYI